MEDFMYRIHPAIGVARVGNSSEYYLAPESTAGIPVDDTGKTGGLPIKAGTESDTVTAADLRDDALAMKRQAVRFRIFQYPASSAGQYPAPGGEEVTIGDKVGQRKIVDIIWSVHVANKKANNFRINERLGMEAYENGNVPPMRNVPDWLSHTDGKGISEQPDKTRATAEDAGRRKTLVIDPGPRTISSANSKSGVGFDLATEASFLNIEGKVEPIPNYPKTFPQTSGLELFEPAGEIDSLGELRIESFSGRLLFVPGAGNAVGWKVGGERPALESAINNDQWFDDVADGPVNATLVFDDATQCEVAAAWLLSTDPAWAPQTLNVVSLWDDIFDTWIRKLKLKPNIFDNGKFNPEHKAVFSDDIFPIFRAASLQRWNTNLPEKAIAGHEYVNRTKADDDPENRMHLPSLIRNPDGSQDQEGTPLMPLSLGDAGLREDGKGKSFLSVSQTQYFLLNQWYTKKFIDVATAQLGFGEALDKHTLMNCLGGRFNPGIEASYNVRDPDLYQTEWATAGPFRVKPANINYKSLLENPDGPVLTGGYIPLQTTDGLEPGDISKFMSAPWHTDYNSCATHVPVPNPPGGNDLYWSWPAQRPVAVYTADDAVLDTASQTWSVNKQRFSVRGTGTESPDPKQQGRYQKYLDFVMNWPRLGFVIQGGAIDPTVKNANDFYLEVCSQFKKEGDDVAAWPMATLNPVDSEENPSS